MYSQDHWVLFIPGRGQDITTVKRDVEGQFTTGTALWRLTDQEFLVNLGTHHFLWSVKNCGSIMALLLATFRKKIRENNLLPVFFIPTTSVRFTKDMFLLP